MVAGGGFSSFRELSAAARLWKRGGPSNGAAASTPPVGVERPA